MFPREPVLHSLSTSEAIAYYFCGSWHWAVSHPAYVRAPQLKMLVTIQTPVALPDIFGDIEEDDINQAGTYLFAFAIIPS